MPGACSLEAGGGGYTLNKRAASLQKGYPFLDYSQQMSKCTWAHRLEERLAQSFVLPIGRRQEVSTGKGYHFSSLQVQKKWSGS